MDRLICGDVGFGKTEVAIRAAFKAVMSGKQVAVLVPTTVLAQQHFKTFRERMADYPVRIELLSRFRTRPSNSGRSAISPRAPWTSSSAPTAWCRAMSRSKSWAGGDRRGTAVRRGPEGNLQADAPAGGCAHPERHAHSHARCTWP
jgi:hypothetical protein